jgi:hypothetical protein
MEPIISEDSKADQINQIVKYFKMHRGTHGLYALRYFGCEVLNFINVVGQIFFLDLFLGYEFSTYGTDVVNYSEMDPFERQDPMHIVFPKVSQTTFVSCTTSNICRYR